MTMDIEQARFNMVEQQIRPWDVLDQRILDLLMSVPREHFVPQGFGQLAFADMQIPLGQNEVMLEPRVEARMLQALSVTAADNILEVGSGSGYTTALLAKLGHHVWSLDIVAEFTKQVEEKLAALHIENVTLETADIFNYSYSPQVPYDVIAVTGSIPVLPEDLKNSLSVGGRLFVVVGEPPVMEAQLIRRLSQTEWSTEFLFETCLPALHNVPETEAFVF